MKSGGTRQGTAAIGWCLAAAIRPNWKGAVMTDVEIRPAAGSGGAAWLVDEVPELAQEPEVVQEKVLDGAALLDEARSFMSRFAVLPSPAALDAVVLWAAHTHAVNAFNASPRLAVLSDLPASGKTRVLELAGLLSHDPCQEVDITGPALVAMISQRQPTVLLDEVDTIFGAHGGNSHNALRGVLNAGYKQGATHSRRSGGAFIREAIYSAIAFGGLGILPGTLMSRSIVIRMGRRKPGQQLERYLPRMHAPLGAATGEALGEWVRSVSLDLASSWPELPEGLEDRAAEIWEPLLAVADAAGGDWPERARAACMELALGSVTDPVESPGQRVLADLRRAWGAAGNLPTAELITRLYALDGAPWATLWPKESAPRELAALLAPFGVRPVKIRNGSRTAQGYRRDDMARAWGKMGAPAAEGDVPDVPEHETCPRPAGLGWAER